MVFQCDRCKSTFAKAQGLARHAARKTPCGVLASNGAENQCQRCGRTYATLGNLNKHIRTSCKVVEPTITVEEKLARMQAHIESLERTLAEVKNTSGNSVFNVNANNVTNIVNIVPWGCDLKLSDSHVEEALSRIPGLTGPTAPEIVDVLMTLVKMAHESADARNICINQQRADQALALTASGWAALPLSEATEALFDKASARIEKRAPSKVVQTDHMRRIRDLQVEVPMQYRRERVNMLQLGLKPMGAHLMNTRPGGPGPLSPQSAAGACTAVASAGAAVASAGAAGAGNAGSTYTSATLQNILQERPAWYTETGAIAKDWVATVCQSKKIAPSILYSMVKTAAENGECLEEWQGFEISVKERMRLVEPPKPLL